MSNRTKILHLVRMTALALALVAAPSSVRGQVEGAARARAGLDQASAARFDAALEQARAQGLPTESLVNKALEGVAKQVPPARIMAAVEQRLALLGRARAALAPGHGAAEISAVADAMQRGVSAEVVQRVRQQAGGEEPIAVAVHVVADLAERGVPVDVALDVLSAWRQRGAPASELPDLPAGVDRLVRQGMRPAQAGQALAASMRAGHSAGAPGRSGTAGRPSTTGRPDRPPPDPASRGGRGRGQGPPPLS